MLAGTCGVPCLMKFFKRENTFEESAGVNMGQQSKSLIEIGCRASNGSDDGFVVADNGFEVEVSPGVWQTQQQNGCAGFRSIKNRIQCFSVSCCFDDRVERLTKLATVLLGERPLVPSVILHDVVEREQQVVTEARRTERRPPPRVLRRVPLDAKAMSTLELRRADIVSGTSVPI